MNFPKARVCPIRLVTNHQAFDRSLNIDPTCLVGMGMGGGSNVDREKNSYFIHVQ